MSNLFIKILMDIYQYVTGNIYNVLRASPSIFIIGGLLVIFVYANIWSIGYFIGAIITTIVNGVLKELILRPLYKYYGTTTFPILGRGLRPKGAMNCGDFITCPAKVSSTFGMPSGHSQLAWFTVVFIALWLKQYYKRKLKNRNNKIKYYIGVSTLIIIGLAISYSRIIFGCHTIQQVVIGGLIGIGIAFATNSVILKIDKF